MAAAVLLGPATLGAQVITGKVLDAANAPISGAVLVLVDTVGHRIASAVAALDGKYKVEVGGAGTFWLRVTSPRHVPTTSPAFTVERGEEVVYDHVVPPLGQLEALAQRGRACPTSAPRGEFVGTPPLRLRVVDEATSEGVPNAIVALVDKSGQVRTAGTTAADGRVGLGFRPEDGDAVCVRKIGTPLTTRPSTEAPPEGTAPWLVLVRAPARELTPVEVKASRAQRMKDLGVPATARFFGLEDFQGYVPSALNFGDLLRPMNAPGVGLRSANGRVNCVLLRGTNCIPTLLDGIPSNTVYDLDPFMIEGIAVLNPTDAFQLYGNIGVQGLVIIYTKRPEGKKARR